MTRTTVSIHIGHSFATTPASPPTDGARIEIHFPNTPEPAVITVERQGDAWLARHGHRDCAPFEGRATFAAALDDALLAARQEVDAWH
jgi:hypothetical protein